MWKDLPFRGWVYFSVVLNLTSFISILVLRNYLPPVVPLFYGLPAGTEQLAPAIGLFLAPVLGLFTIFVNVVVGNMTRNIFLRRTLIVSSTSLSILLAVAVIKIILLVGFF